MFEAGGEDAIVVRCVRKISGIVWLLLLVVPLGDRDLLCEGPREDVPIIEGCKAVLDPVQGSI